MVRSCTLRLYPTQAQKRQLLFFMTQMRKLQEVTAPYLSSIQSPEGHAKLFKHLTKRFPTVPIELLEQAFTAVVKNGQAASFIYQIELQLDGQEPMRTTLYTPSQNDQYGHRPRNRHYLCTKCLGPIHCAKIRIPPSANTVSVRIHPNQHFQAIYTHITTERHGHAHAPIGIDLGTAVLATCSNTLQIRPTARFIKASQAVNQLKHHRHLCIKNRNQAKLQLINEKIKRLERRQSNRQKDFMRKWSRTIVQPGGTIVLESLDIPSIIRRSKPPYRFTALLLPDLLKSIHQRADELGARVLHIDRWYPSSQLCSICGAHIGKHPLHQRTITCPYCHHRYDRDLNASRNILQQGLRLLSSVG